MFKIIRRTFWVLIAFYLSVYGIIGLIEHFDKPIPLTSASELPSHVGKKVTLPVSELEDTGIKKDSSRIVAKKTRHYYLATSFDDDVQLIFYGNENTTEKKFVTGYVTEKRFDDIKATLYQKNPDYYGKVNYYSYHIEARFDWLLDIMLDVAFGILLLITDLMSLLRTDE